MLSSFKSLTETDMFSMFSPKRQLVGLDIGSSAIKLVQLKESKGGTFSRSSESNRLSRK